MAKQATLWKVPKNESELREWLITRVNYIDIRQVTPETPEYALPFDYTWEGSTIVDEFEDKRPRLRTEAEIDAALTARDDFFREQNQLLLQEREERRRAFAAKMKADKEKARARIAAAGFDVEPNEALNDAAEPKKEPEVVVEVEKQPDPVAVEPSPTEPSSRSAAAPVGPRKRSRLEPISDPPAIWGEKSEYTHIRISPKWAQWLRQESVEREMSVAGVLNLILMDFFTQ